MISRVSEFGVLRWRRSRTISAANLLVVRTIYLLALTLLFVIPAARADDGVLVDHVPGGASPAIVLAVVKQALINRHWTIEAVDEMSVRAAIERSNNDVKLHVTLRDGQLLYQGSAIETRRSRVPLEHVHQEVRVPTRWIENLRKDIAIILSILPEEATPG